MSAISSCSFSMESMLSSPFLKACFSSTLAAFMACTVCTLSLMDSSVNAVWSMLNCWLYSCSRWPSYSRFCFSTCVANHTHISSPMQVSRLHTRCS